MYSRRNWGTESLSGLCRHPGSECSNQAGGVLPWVAVSALASKSQLAIVAALAETVRQTIISAATAVASVRILYDISCNLPCYPRLYADACPMNKPMSFDHQTRYTMKTGTCNRSSKNDTCTRTIISIGPGFAIPAPSFLVSNPPTPPARREPCPPVPVSGFLVQVYREFSPDTCAWFSD